MATALPFPFLKTLFSKSDEKFGTFKGVFVPTIVQMIGVILFMRLGWLTGHVGIVAMCLIIAMSSLILFITTLSLTSIVTNMKMGGGGVYYIISRSLGVEFGAGIGILLLISQITSIALNASGFALSVHQFAPFIPMYITKVVVIALLALLSYYSTDLALKLQTVIFVVIFVGLGSFFLGSPSLVPQNLPINETMESLPFWIAFAMFFPAASGIEAGMSLSGELKNPARSLPIGTIGAVITMYGVYTLSVILFGSYMSSDILKSNPLIGYYISRIGFLYLAALWGATLSSALGSILGAPRTLQAIAKDQILPKFLAKGHGPLDQPRVATLVVLGLGVTLALLVPINQLIPILTMVFMMTYVLINFVTFFESIMKNPNYRPTFTTPWWVSLTGTLSCIMGMFMINAGATFCVLFLVIVITFWAARKSLEVNLGDLRYGLFSFLAKLSSSQLQKLSTNPRSWRPNILAIVTPEVGPSSLVHFARSLNQSRGFLTFASSLTPKLRSSDLYVDMQRFTSQFKQENMQGFYHFNLAANPIEGFKHMIENYGIGPIRPNTVLLSQDLKSTYLDEFCRTINSSYILGKNIVVLKAKDSIRSSVFSSKPVSKISRKRICIWWQGKAKRNLEFSLNLAHLLQHSQTWKDSLITVKTFIKSHESKTDTITKFNEIAHKLRMYNIGFQPITLDDADFYANLGHHSQDAHLAIIGMRPPHKDETHEDYKYYHQSLIEKTSSMDNVCYVLAGESLSAVSEKPTTLETASHS